MSTIINAIITSNLAKREDIDTLIANAPAKRLDGKFADKNYNQRSQTLPIAHVRFVLGTIRQHNVVYGNIVTMLDVAKHSPECKREMRAMILAMPEIHSEHYSSPRIASKIVKRANEIVAKVNAAVAADSSGVEMGDEVLVDGQTGEVAAA